MTECESGYNPTTMRTFYKCVVVEISQEYDVTPNVVYVRDIFFPAFLSNMNSFNYEVTIVGIIKRNMGGI
jgi:hypothetical protein